MKIPETEILVALITSIVAFIAAIISSLFSYFSNKRSAKVDAMQAYIQFLQHKMNRLEELLKSVDYSNNTNTVLEACHLHDYYNKFLRGCEYLFTDNKELSKLKELDDNTIMPNVRCYTNNNGNGAKLAPTELVNAIIMYCNGITELISSEIKRTYDKFERLSMLK